MDVITINGEMITADEAKKLVCMLYDDARKFAGEFHNMERSAKFRVNWPNEYLFADANYMTFIEPTRMLYAARLGDPKTPPEDARKMHLALVLQAQMAKGQETDNRLQLAPNTQQFEGDRFENKKILDTFGKRPNLRAALMNASAATRH